MVRGRSHGTTIKNPDSFPTKMLCKWENHWKNKVLACLDISVKFSDIPTALAGIHRGECKVNQAHRRPDMFVKFSDTARQLASRIF
jgi:hypothetical protein